MLAKEKSEIMNIFKKDFLIYLSLEIPIIIIIIRERLLSI